MKFLTSNNAEIISIEDHVKNSEMVKENVFNYKLNDKAAKNKLLKAANRPPIEIEENSTSTNMVFSAGAWVHAVLPATKYWGEVPDSKTCKIGDYTVQIGGVKESREMNGKRINTQIVFFAEREKIVCHMYNTTQLILINGHGYKKFIDIFLKPFLTSKINENIMEIEEYNEQVMKKLGTKTVRRSEIKLRKGPSYPCQNCEHTAKSVIALKRHRKEEHILSLDISNKLADQKQSTRNNSLVEMMMIEDLTVNELTLRDTKPKEVSYKYTCDTCDFVTLKKASMDEHVVKQHLNREDEEVKYLCTDCKDEFDDAGEYEEHVSKHALNQETQDLKHFENLIYIAILEKHAAHLAQSENVEEKVAKNCETITCHECELSFTSEENMKAHMQTIHKSLRIKLVKETIGNLKCKKCDYTCKLNIQMKKHMESIHVEDNFAYGCDLCEFRDDFLGNIWKHKIGIHHEDFQFNKYADLSSKDLMLNLLAEQNSNMIQELTTLKDFIKELYERLTDEFVDTFKGIQKESDRKDTEMKKELLSMRQDIEKLDQVSNVIPATSSNTVETTKISTEKTKPGVNQKKPQNRRTKYQQKPKVLVVGDSLAHNANYRRIEVVTDTTIKTAKAYSSAWDDTVRFKDKNITDVTEKELRDASFDYLVLAAPTVDITNLDTKKKNNDDDGVVLKNKVVTSCKNMMKIAENALNNDENMKKVTIMNHAPRFDSRDVDPLSLKPKLASFANNYLLELWIDSPHKERIHIGNHDLDGVHLYGSQGRVAYTESVLDILLTSFQTPNPAQDHISCPQAINAKKQRLYSSVLKGSPGIKTQNRFSILANNVGNW